MPDSYLIKHYLNQWETEQDKQPAHTLSIKYIWPDYSKQQFICGSHCSSGDFFYRKGRLTFLPSLSEVGRPLLIKNLTLRVAVFLLWWRASIWHAFPKTILSFCMYVSMVEHQIRYFKQSPAENHPKQAWNFLLSALSVSRWCFLKTCNIIHILTDNSIQMRPH